MEMFNSYVSDLSKKLVNEVLESGQLSEGPMVKRFEAVLKERGFRNAVCVNSGTSALHLGLILAGVRTGTEVILPAQTFLATGMVVKYLQATPVFCDIDPHTGLMDPDSVKKKITQRTKAIMPVHWGGNICPLYEIDTASGQKPMVVDAAQAFGATYKGENVADTGDFVAFSLQATKQLSAGDGGILCCSSMTHEGLARKLRWFGLSRDQRHSTLGDPLSFTDRVGYKYHMNDIAAAIGLGNLEEKDEPLRADPLLHRADLANSYLAGLLGVGGLEIPLFSQGRVWYFYSILAERREDLAKKLIENGCCCSVVSRRIDRHPVFGGVRGDLPGTAEYDRKHLALPIHEGITSADVEKILTIIREGW